MGDASEGTVEVGPAPAEAAAKTTAPELDVAEAPAISAGSNLATRAAGMLMAGGVATPVTPRARLRPEAALALQRGIGNRALSRRVLARDVTPPSTDQVKENVVPYIIEASGPNDAASKMADYTSDRSENITILVVDTKQLYAYDKAGNRVGSIEEVVATQWDPGVWIAEKPAFEPIPVGWIDGKIAWDRDIVRGLPSFRVLAKPPPNATSKQQDATFEQLVANPAEFRKLLTGDYVFFVVPYYRSGGGKKGGGKDGPSGSDTASLSGKDKGEPPNAPAFPSYLTGNDQAGAGSYSTYTMELVYGTNTIDQTLGAMTWVTYTWERWDLGNVKRDSLEATLKGAAVGEAKKDPTHESGVLEATGRHWADDAKQAKEDYETALTSRRVRGQSRWSALKDLLSNEISLKLAPFSWIVSAGGNLLQTVGDARPQRRVEKEMPWPAKPGLYCVRCIAQVDAMVDGKNPDGTDNIVRHAPSVATLLVEVKDPQSIANEAADKAELDLLQSQLALQNAIDKQRSEKEIADLRKTVETARVEARGSSVEVLQAAIAALTEKKNRLDPADYLRRNPIDDQIADLNKAAEVVRKRKLIVDPSGKTQPVRLNASFVSSKGGLPSALILDLYECPDSTWGAYHYRLSDVTSKDSPAFPDATDPDRKAAIISALEQYRTHAGLGPGYLAARIAPELVGDAPERPPIHWQGKTAEQGWGQAKQHLSDALLIASIIATAFGGGEVMIAIGVLGGATAAINIIDRAQTGNFRIDDSQSIQDIIAVIGAVAPGVTALGRLAILRLGEYSMFATAIGDAEALQRAASAIKITERSVKAFEHANELLGKVGLFLSTDDTIQEFQKIRQQERDGEISHNEAERQRLSAFSRAASNLGLYVVQHEAPAGAREDPAVALKQQSESNARVAKMIEEHQATEATRKTLEELKAAQAQVDKAVADLNATKPADEELRRRQDELAAKDAELAKKFAELEKLEAARQAAGGGGKEPPGKGPPGGSGGGEGPPSSGPRRLPTTAQAEAAFKTAVLGNGDPTAAAHDLIRTVGDWKSGLKRVLGTVPDGPLRRAAEQALVQARDQIVASAWKAAGGFEDLVPRDFGTKAFGSDIDITVRPKELPPPGADVSKLIERSTEAATALKEALRAELGGLETDAAIDTNVYSYIGEGALVPSTAPERSASVAFQQITGMAETLRGAGTAGFAELLAQVRARAQGDPAAIKHLNELALEAKRFVDARAAEERSARRQVRAEQPNLKPDALNRAVRDRIVDAKKGELAKAAVEKPPDIGKIERLQAEILWFEPDAYATRATIDQTVGQTQAKRSAGTIVTPAEAIAQAQAAYVEAQKSGTPEDIAHTRSQLDAALTDRDAIADAQAKLDAVKAEKVGNDQKSQVDQAHKIRGAELELDEAQRRFRSRMVFEDVAAIDAQAQARGYSPEERRTISAAIATAQLGMMVGHVREAHDAGAKVKYVCKYGARILEAIMLAGVPYKGSIAASALIDMFTQSRWTFNEGSAGVGMVRDMLIRYATETGKPVNMEDGRAVGVSSEVQQAFVKDVLSYMQGATAKMTGESLRTGELRGVLQDARIAVDAADQHGGDAKLRDQAIRQRVADTVAAELTSATTDVKDRTTGETREVKYTSETDLDKQLATMDDRALLPRSFQEARTNLENAKDGDSRAIRKALPAIVKALRTARYYSEVLADAAALAAERGISTNEALIELAKRTGIKVREVAQGSVKNFFQEVATVPEYFIDNDIGDDHGNMTHMLQDLAVDRALDEDGIKERAPQLRARLRHLPGTAGGAPTGIIIWNSTWDDENSRDFGTPEMLRSALAKYGVT